VKKWLAGVEKIVFFHGREVWFVRLGKNVGREQNGGGKNFQRPVIVLRKFDSETFLAVPLTSKMKRGRFYFLFEFNGKPAVALLSQIRVLDKKRIQRKIGEISKKDALKLERKLIRLIKSDPSPSRSKSGGLGVPDRK